MPTVLPIKDRIAGCTSNFLVDHHKAAIDIKLKLRIRGFMSNISSGIHVSPIFGKVLYECPCKIIMQKMFLNKNYRLILKAEKQIRATKLHTASFPATKAPETAVMPTMKLTGRASLLTFAAPRTHATDSAGGSGMTTERAVQKRPE
ncbi:LOW QUALITY PROTEIN: hypothetical protein CFOL_v3_18264 [Cephalotus follicularis]|uniref:Uncharacterized protein n=1 Tax=Cephalotus follicularis TaxID=3775 RepID=A0A1Q3C3G0_CEPFO|nr:LOW QUALITY PROTEIN: hypothetical protein CFOL_v3_18264 [Cephalotus follicularis]